jgi:indolepyruvate ferredoxin oxidoreductase alpha subunit
VAADPLYTVAYTGVNAGLVVIVADDPGMHSSQNEQDSRFHARASLTPMLEPADSAECLAFTKLAFELSEKYDTPVLIRLTTRISHARSLVEPGTRADAPIRAYVKDITKNVMIPGMARGRHVLAEARINAIAADSSEWDISKIEMRDAGLGIVCSGAVYQYVREALPEASVLKLGIVNPLPHALIERFAAQVSDLYVMEELEPVIQEQISPWGIACRGVHLTGRQGELSAVNIAAMFRKKKKENVYYVPPLPARPPVMCPGCPHRGPFSVIKKLKLTAMGDIGCYTLGALAPLDALDTSLCMGASVGMAQGMGRAGKKTIAVIGDSTFVHSGITSLLSAAYNNNDLTVLILDNATTGMTGHQHNPATGYDIRNRPAFKLSLEEMCEACGASSVRVLDAFDLDGLEKALREETERPGVSAIIARRPCALLKPKLKDPPAVINAEKCKRCMACMNLGCPSIEKNNNVIRINPSMCAGCGLCKKVCRFGAIGNCNE